MKDGTSGAVLYTRPGCAPCFALKRLAARAARRRGMTLAIVDITGDPALEARYGLRVPVLLLPGGEILEGRVEAGEIERAFRAGVRGWGRLAATLRAALHRGVGPARRSDPR